MNIGIAVLLSIYNISQVPDANLVYLYFKNRINYGARQELHNFI